MQNSLHQIAFISFFRFYYLLTSVSFYSYIPLYFSASGFDARKVGTLFAIQSSMSILTYLPSGFINDRLSAKKQIFCATFIYCIFTLGLNIATNYTHFLILFTLWGISATMLDNSTNILYYKESQIVNNRLFFSFFGITSTLSYALGGKLGSALSSGNNFRPLFMTVFIMSLFLILFSRTLPDTRVQSVRLKDYHNDIFSFKSLIIAANLFLFTYHWGAELTSFTVFFKTYAALDNNLISYIYLEVGLLMSFIVFTLGYYRERIKLDPLCALLIAVAASGGSQATMCYCTTFTTALINQFFHAIGDSFFIYYWLNIIPATFKYEKLGGASAFVNLFTVLSVIAGSFISGVIANKFSNAYAPFLMSAALGSLIYPLAIISRYKINSINKSIKVSEENHDYRKTAV